MKLPFPIHGLHEGLPAETQPPTTSPVLQNVRPYDKEERRGGQRPGLEKSYETQVGGDNPIILINQIVTTYIEPEA